MYRCMLVNSQMVHITIRLKKVLLGSTANQTCYTYDSLFNRFDGIFLKTINFLHIGDMVGRFFALF